MRFVAVLAVLSIASGCRDLSRFSSKRDSFEGPVVNADFVRAGVVQDTRTCLLLDTDHLQDAPGTISTSDGRFARTPLRPIPQLWHDPLSTLQFGDGRVQNLVYAATPTGETNDVMVVISLMESSKIEVRFLRSAPPLDASAPSAAMFAVFNLERRDGSCTY